jgi:hypothetical protein
MLPSGLGDQLCNPLPALLWKWLLLCLFTGISDLEVYFFASSPFSGAGCVPPALSTDHVLFQFAVCFSVLQGSSVLDAPHWLRR